MIITCPNCQTKYQVADKSIGSAGRKVQCAHCRESWQAMAELPPQAKPKVQAAPENRPKKAAPPEESDQLFGAEDEAALDRAFEEAEGGKAAPVASAQSPEGEDEVSQPSQNTPRPVDPVRPIPAASATARRSQDEGAGTKKNSPVDQSEQQNRLEALYKRQKKLASQSPLAKMRRVVRVLSFAVLLAVLGGGLIFRTDIVRALPDLGGLYAAIGLGVNVDGLIFSSVHTVRTMRDGVDVMVISAKIENVSNVSHDVPPVLVSILDGNGMPMYQWKARAKGDVVGVGEAVQFETHLNSAPLDAQKVQLVFTREKLNKSGLAHR